ncbi:hypothetical protein EDD18DRAFT_1465225 [Armillaria luteobubalina]|uniref:Uncharacterized protein n=1 Tax=Armillaria luteobubalina TaxID=153913 RepID=A0AA39PZ25_9AGAR|nr:hypothetical protein EDD18DRAFT_1465225 [Armillaria luteobubalina]
MAWALEAIWDANTGQYLVYWSSRFYDEADTAHAGTATECCIVSTYTSDFRMFIKATNYIVVPGTPIINLMILPLPDGETFGSSRTRLHFGFQWRALWPVDEDRRWVCQPIRVWGIARLP